MNCPNCNSKTTVTNTGKDVDMIIRRRKCKSCGYAFFTQEIDYSDPKAMKLINELKEAYHNNDM